MSVEYYGANDYRYYLAHHGIKGQKWGVRRFQNEDGTLTSAGRKRKEYGIIRRTRDRISGHIETNRQIVRNTRNAKGIGNKASELFGYGRARTVDHVRQATEKRLAEHSRTRLGKALHEQRSANAGYRSKYYGQMQKADFGEKFMEQYVFPSKAMNVPYRRLSGRTTTIGKSVADNLLTGGAIGLAKDVTYMRQKSSKAKSNSSSTRPQNQSSQQKPKKAKKEGTREGLRDATLAGGLIGRQIYKHTHDIPK